MEVTSSNHQINKTCKYCSLPYQQGELEGLSCAFCRSFVHVKCLKRGAVPGGLVGDVFFEFTCQECSKTGTELFIRSKMPWLQAILLVVYHMQFRNAGLTKKGYLHWKLHIATFIDRNWDILFRKDFKRKKKWTGTVSGTLSHYSPLYFKSGTTLFNEQGWWTLSHPMLSPDTIVQINAEFMIKKQKRKELKMECDDQALLKSILWSKQYISEESLKATSVEPSRVPSNESNDVAVLDTEQTKVMKSLSNNKKRKLPLLPTIDSLTPKRVFMKYGKFFDNKGTASNKHLFKKVKYKEHHSVADRNNHEIKLQSDDNSSLKPPTEKPQLSKYLDPMCHYNTSLETGNQQRSLKMLMRLTGGIRKDPILSPYSSTYLKPYIRRDAAINPPWLQLMDELQVKVREEDSKWALPPRSPIEFTYVQPEHIPAVNSLCNQFFWTGIDLSDTLEYPDFSCVVLYRKLIVAFAFLVPNVKVHESYLSFIFTRPGWRNKGIARFMLYHLIQTNLGKDITLHVSISNPALFLYQKFGFKVEYVVLDFYDRYLPSNTRESKHAFFCRLER